MLGKTFRITERMLDWSSARRHSMCQYAAVERSERILRSSRLRHNHHRRQPQTSSRLEKFSASNLWSRRSCRLPLFPHGQTGAKEYIGGGCGLACLLG